MTGLVHSSAPFCTICGSVCIALSDISTGLAVGSAAGADCCPAAAELATLGPQRLVSVPSRACAAVRRSAVTTQVTGDSRAGGRQAQSSADRSRRLRVRVRVSAVAG